MLAYGVGQVTGTIIVPRVIRRSGARAAPWSLVQMFVNRFGELNYAPSTSTGSRGGDFGNCSRTSG